MKRAGKNQTEVAEAVGLQQPSIGRLLSGETKMTRWIEKIAQTLDTTSAYICGETASPEAMSHVLAEDDRFVMLPQIRVGDITSREALIRLEETGAPVTFPRHWVQKMVDGGIADLFVVSVDGDAMMPTLIEGDPALVDAAKRELGDPDRLWCIAYGGVGMVRRVRRLPDGRLRLAADNPAFPPIDGDESECELIGRIIWIGRQV